jgi:hypothetical protein
VASRPDPPVPVRIGPCEFELLGAMVAVRCPSDFAPLMRQAGGQWDPGSRRWLVRGLRRATDPPCALDRIDTARQ